MKIKCILCSFLKNMWKDIKFSIIKELKEPFDWTPIILYFSVSTLVFVSVWLWSNYAETIRIVFYYCCAGLGYIFSLATIIWLVYNFGKWIKKIYIKSKEECE